MRIDHKSGLVYIYKEHIEDLNLLDDVRRLAKSATVPDSNKLIVDRLTGKYISSGCGIRTIITDFRIIEDILSRPSSKFDKFISYPKRYYNLKTSFTTLLQLEEGESYIIISYNGGVNALIGNTNFINSLKSIFIEHRTSNLQLDKKLTYYYLEESIGRANEQGNRFNSSVLTALLELLRSSEYSGSVVTGITRRSSFNAPSTIEINNNLSINKYYQDISYENIPRSFFDYSLRIIRDREIMLNNNRERDRINRMNRDRRHPINFNYTKSKLTPESIIGRINKKNINNSDYIQLEQNLKKFNCLNGTDSQTNLIMEGIPYTFGVELETIDGSFENHLNEVKHLNVRAVHDGSLRDLDGNGEPIGEPWGKEYVTGVLYGDDGFNQLNEICKTIRKRCKVDKRCSVHVHMGTLKWNSSEIVLAYLLGLLIEDDIFKMLPSSRRNNKYCSNLIGINNKRFENPMKAKNTNEYKIRMNFLYNEVFRLVSESIPGPNLNKRTGHPRGQHGGYDPQRDHRYKWLNFTNIIFRQRGHDDYKTIEFRNHSGTLNFNKVKNWILIVAAYCQFVHNHKDIILNTFFSGGTLTVNDLVEATYSSKTSSKLIEYINVRKDLFSKDSLKQELEDYNEETSKLTKKQIICA